MLLLQTFFYGDRVGRGLDSEAINQLTAGITFTSVTSLSVNCKLKPIVPGGPTWCKQTSQFHTAGRSVWKLLMWWLKCMAVYLYFVVYESNCTQKALASLGSLAIGSRAIPTCVMLMSLYKPFQN